MTTQRIDIADDAVASRVVAIQRAAYRIEAELMSFDGIPQLHEGVSDVQSLQDLEWLGAFQGDEIVGVIAWVEQGDVVDIDRLAVSPSWARQGFGRSLLRSVPSSSVIEVSTGSANAPAISLYETEGFELVGTTEVAPGVHTSQFRKVAAGN